MTSNLIARPTWPNFYEQHLVLFNNSTTADQYDIVFDFPFMPRVDNTCARCGNATQVDVPCKSGLVIIASY